VCSTLCPASAGQSQGEDDEEVEVVEDHGNEDDGQIFITPMLSWQISHTAFERSLQVKPSSQINGKRPRSKSRQAKECKRVCINPFRGISQTSHSRVRIPAT